MSEHSVAQAPVKVAMPAQLAALQRACACGEHSYGEGECEACKTKWGQLQRKLAVGASNDPLEQEADRIANQVLAAPAHAPVSGAPLSIRRLAGPLTGPAGTAPASVDRALSQPGALLGPALEAEMEQRFGHDFSRVRVHSSVAAAQSTLDVDAHAYTVGQHIVFGASRYAPSTRDGMQLIAHELTHVVQQSGTDARGGSTPGVLQREPRSEALLAPPDADFVLLQGSEGAPSEADTAQARASEAVPVPQPRSAGPLGSPQRTDAPAPAVQSLGPQAPPTDLDPGATVGEALDAATDTSAPANATQAAPATDHSSIPRLRNLLSQPQPQVVAIEPSASLGKIAGESAAPDEVSQDSEVDIGALLGRLAVGAGEARKTINAHSITARSDFNWRAKRSSKKVEEQTKTADEAVHAIANERRIQLERTILAHETEINWLEETSKETATTYSQNAKKAQTEGFASYRGQMADAFDRWVRRIEKLNKKQANRLTSETAKNAREARRLAELYDKQYISGYGGQSEERREVQRDAVNEVAEAYAREIEKTIPEVIPEIGKACGQITTELNKSRDEALVEFDKGLPAVLSGIDQQLVAAHLDIVNKARELRGMLAKAALEMHGRVRFLEEAALKRNSNLHTKIDGEIESGRACAEEQFRRATPEAIEPIAAIVDEAVGMLTSSDEDLDPDASRQFVDEVVNFSLDAADATGVVFGEAHDASVGTLARAVPFAKRGLAAGKQDLEATLRLEGAENESALITFGTEAERYLHSSVIALDATFNAAVEEADDQLLLMLNGTREKLREPMEKAEEDIKRSVNEVLSRQSHAIWRLPKVMHSAARDAAWRYDHPYLKHVVDVIEVALGFALMVAILVAVVVALVFAVGELAAAVIIGVVGGFLAGYFGAKAYEERRKAGASPRAALLGAIGDVTGLNDVRRAFTDSKMAPFDRGMAWGGFWLGLFGFASGGSRFLRMIKVRLPKKFTNPFRLKRPMVPATMPEGPVVPALPEAPAIPERVGYQLPHQKSHGPEVPAAPVSPDVSATPSPRVGGFARKSEPTVPVSPDAPATPSRRVGGFARKSEPTVPVSPDAPATPSRRVGGFARKSEPTVPVSPDAPATPSRRVGGFARKSEPAAPVSPEVPAKPPASTAPTSKAPLVETQTPPAREVPSSQATGGNAAGQRGEQGAQATASPHDVAPPKASTPDAASTGTSTKGKVVSSVERAQPAAAAPSETVPPIVKPQSRRMAAAERSVAESQPRVTKAQEATAAAEARVKALEEELEVAKQLRSELGRNSKEAQKFLAKTEGDLSRARKELRASQKALKKTTREAQDVARAQEAIRSLEQEIADIDRQMAELTREPEPGTQLSPTENIRPPTSTEKGRKYSQLEKLRAKRINALVERTEGIDALAGQQVARMTPGAEGRPHALANAEALGDAHPAIKPVDGRPIDVTTGKPIQTDDWASDHIMSRNEIASDPRFVLLDPAGRAEMLLGIPENYLPLTTEANSSKGSLKMNEWLARRSARDAIRLDIADALRAADRKARAAVDAKFEELLGAKP